MKATELRIGNWVIQDGELIKGVTSLTIHNFSIGKIKLEPVTLTEELAISFYFYQHPKKNRIKGYYLLDGLELYFVNVKGFNRTYCYINNGGIRNNIQHVHELQNLYFALTGEEL